MTCRRTLTGAGRAKRGVRLGRAPRCAWVLRIAAVLLGLVVVLPVRTDALLSGLRIGGVNQLAADAVGAGNRPTATASGSSTVTVSWVASTMASGSAVDGYTVQRYPQTSGAGVPAGGTCSGLVASLSCIDAAVPTGAWTYTVIPHRVGWLGSESLPSTAVTVGRYATVLFPIDGGSYTRTEWGAVHGTCAASTICGMAGTDTGALTEVAVSLRNETTGQCWDGGAKFNQACPNFVVAAGTTQWSRSVPAGRLDAGSTYSLIVRITDGGGSAVFAGPTFSIT